MAGRRGLLACQVLIGVIIVWAVSSILALAFRCELPRPWDFEGKCLDQASEICYRLWEEGGRGVGGSVVVCTDEMNFAGSALQVHRSNKYHHRRRTHHPPLHRRLGRPSIALEAMDRRGSLRDPDPSLRRDRCPSPLHCHPHRFLR